MFFQLSVRCGFCGYGVGGDRDGNESYDIYRLAFIWFGCLESVFEK